MTLLEKAHEDYPNLDVEDISLDCPSKFGLPDPERDCITESCITCEECWAREWRAREAEHVDATN